MNDHLLHLDRIGAEGYAEWSMACNHEPGGRWRVTLPDGTPDPNFDEAECWFESWWSALGAELLDDIEGPITLPLAVRPSPDWNYDDGGAIVREVPNHE